MSGIVGTNAGRSSGKVGTVAIGADAITGDEIADDVLDSEHYVAASIDNEHLADDAVGTDEIADNAVTLAKMAGGTDGNIISFDASGNPVAIATGSDGQVLTSAGSGAPPAFEAAAGGGKVLQVVSAIKTDTQTTTNDVSSWVDVSGLSVTTGTMASSSSKVLVMADVSGIGHPSAGYLALRLVRGSTAINSSASAGNRASTATGLYINNVGALGSLGMHVLDSPSTTSATTYKVQFCRVSGTTVHINRTYDDQNIAERQRGVSSITIMEIGA